MKISVISIIVFIIVISILPTAQGINQQGLNFSIKDQYIKNHPGQAIIPYPWITSTSIKVLPFNFQIPVPPGNNLSIAACRNQFESASFIINARKDLSGIEIHVSDIHSSKGSTIPADAIKVRLVKVWYQGGEGIIEHDVGVRVLTPELLIKDDSLVKLDYVNRTNFLKVTINGVEQYFDISNSTGTFPSNAKIHDTPSLQPFSLKANENKQIWLTVQIPSNTPAGDYNGNIAIIAPYEDPVMMKFSVTVLPFDLEPAPVEYALYYRGVVISTQFIGIDSENKTGAQYALELKNMMDHGVSYPTIYQSDNTELGIALTLRDTIGLPKDKIYVLGEHTWHSAFIGNATDPNGLTIIANKVVNWKNHTSSYGYGDVYFYGMDEARDDILLSERPAWEIIHENGAKVFVAVSGNQNAVESVGDILDIAIFAFALNKTQAAEWHSNGNKIFSYANPQVGVEDPEIYRNNYGFALWNAGYDGAMNYAYQHSYGHIWNDFDDLEYRDHVFAYPTSDGVIDTIQWEGWREGVDDTRYLATLMKMEGSDISARAIISNSLSKGEDMATIREKVIKKILKSSPIANEKLKIGTVSSVWNITRTTFGHNIGIPVNGN